MAKELTFIFKGTMTLGDVVFSIKAKDANEARGYALAGAYDYFDKSEATTIAVDIEPDTITADRSDE